MKFRFSKVIDAHTHPAGPGPGLDNPDVNDNKTFKYWLCFQIPAIPLKFSLIQNFLLITNNIN